MFIILVVILLCQFAVSQGEFASKVVGIRNYITFYLTYSLGKNCGFKENSLKKYFRFFVGICIFAVLVGLLMYTMNFHGWESIGLREVYIAKKDYIIGNQLPGRFQTDFLGHMVNRVASLYYEPVNFAYLLGAGVMVATCAPWTKSVMERLLAVVLLSAGLFLTFGKGGMMITGMSLMCYVTFRIIAYMKSGEERRLKNIFLVLIVLIIYIAGSYYVLHYNAMTNPHFVGIKSTWKSVIERPLGYGLGNGGNANLMFGGVEGNSHWEIYHEWLASGGETALMAFLYQMGIPAFFIFFLCFHGMTTRVVNGKGLGAFRHMIMMIPYILLGISIYQENTYTPQCIAPFMILVGSLAGYIEEKWPVDDECRVPKTIKIGA